MAARGATVTGAERPRATLPSGVRALLLRWLPVLAWMALIFAFSAQPTLPSLPGAWLDVLFKKGAHFGVYAVLAALCWRAFAPRWSAWSWAWMLAVLYACTDEWHQSFVPGRHPAVTDVLIDATGAAMALLIIYTLARRKRHVIPAQVESHNEHNDGFPLARE